MTELQQTKKNKRYILYRIYAPLIWVCFLVWGIFWLITAASDSEPSGIQMICSGVLFPLFAIAVLLFMSILVFPFEYSIFGNLERTHFPDEQPILKITGSYGAIGTSFRGTVPFFNWYVFPSGLGISILGFGKVFVPSELIKELKAPKEIRISSYRYTIIHNSPELHSPVYLPDKRVFEALQILLEQ
jgi:hypothetical protein